MPGRRSRPGWVCNATSPEVASRSPRGTEGVGAVFRSQADIEVLAERLAARGQRQTEAEQGPGLKPSDQATGRSERRSARSHIRATSRWLVKRTLPNLVKRTRSRTSSAGSAPT